MRRLLERYIRSLREQEQSPSSAPEYRQDLGTFVHWLLERHGYRVHVRAFRYDGTERRTATGERQWGIDIAATRQELSGATVGSLFVLKHGDVGSAQWETGPGSLRHDVLLAAELSEADKGRLAPGEAVSRWEVIAVHNGDFNRAQVGSQRDGLIASMMRRHAVEVIWWDANRLTELALEVPVGPGSEPVKNAGEGSEGMFPPGVRPFVHLAMGSLLSGYCGTAFDLAAVDHLVRAVLPQDAPASRQGALTLPRWQRRVLELGLFAEMVAVECTNLKEAKGTTLPALEAYERAICRAVHALSMLLEATRTQAAVKKAKEVLQSLLERYLNLGLRLREHLVPILGVENGLALAATSERLDYPLRAMRLLGYLTAAAHAALDLGRQHEASMLGDAVEELCKHNAAGALTPVLDDQVVELSILWDLLLRMERREAASSTAQEVANRILLRRALGLRMPAMWLPSTVPLADRTVRVLVESQTGVAPEYEDGGSQILSLALYVGWRSSNTDEADEILRMSSPNRGSIASTGEQSARVRAIHLQSWLPPDDAGLFWYAESLAMKGTSHVYPNDGKSEEFFAGFERFNRALSIRSIGEELGLPSVDRIAWKQFRNPPPMAIFVKLFGRDTAAQ
jgi:hypothetical protein